VRMRTSLVGASLFGAALFLPGRPAAAQGPSFHVGSAFRGAAAADPVAFPAPTLGNAWSNVLSAAFGALKSFSNVGFLPSASSAGLPAMVGPGFWAALPAATPVGPERFQLHFGPVQATPVLVPNVAPSVADTRGESFETLGALVTLPWAVP
jgi:hypothetical protein